MTVDPRSPCIIGVSQAISRPADGPSPEPLVLWEEAVRSASDDAGARGDVLGAVDSLQVVYCHSWQYDDAAARLSDRLGIAPAHRYYSGIGGTTSQVLIDNAAEGIVRGELDVGIVVGAEALDTVRRLRKVDERPQWSFKPTEKQPFPFEAPFHPAEIAHQVFQAYTTFALWDVARRAHLGVEPDAYRDSMGALFSPMTTIAAANPYSWFPTERSVRELVDPAPDNRMVAYPYTKYLISVMDVDLSGALDRRVARGGGPSRRSGGQTRSTYGAGATAPMRCTSPSTNRPGRHPRWPRPRPRRCHPQVSASTTSRTSTCTAASRPRSRSPSTRSAWRRTTPAGSPSREDFRTSAARAATT